MTFNIIRNTSGRPFIFFLFLVSIILTTHGAQAQPLSDSSHPVTAAALKMIDVAANPKAVIDTRAIVTLADFVIGSKASKEVELPKVRRAVGAYYEFETGIDFPAFLQYSYTSKIPASLTSPASLRYSLWRGGGSEGSSLPDSWNLPGPEEPALVIRGKQHDGITPDLTTEVYYEYHLVRTLILFNHRGRHILISISKQANISDVGRKGFILGSDDDWNYHYTGDIGSAKAGLGWVKSYIYDYFAVGVHVEAGPAIRSGVFQWIHAGWSGINFARPEHVIKGIKRHARHSKTVLESPRLPAPEHVTAAYRKLSALPQSELLARYAVLQQARHDLAVRTGKIDRKTLPGRSSWNATPKEQIIEALMLEYFKASLGKPSLLGKKLALQIS